MNGLAETRLFLDKLKALAGRELVLSHGLEILICLIAAKNAGQQLDFITLAAKADIRPTTLERYLLLLENIGVVEVEGTEPWFDANPVVALSSEALKELA